MRFRDGTIIEIATLLSTLRHVYSLLCNTVEHHPTGILCRLKKFGEIAWD